MAPSILPQTSLGFVSDSGETVDFSGEDIYEHSVRTDGVYTSEFTLSGEYKTPVLSMGAVVLPDFIANLTYTVLRYTVAPVILLFIILNRKKRVLKYILAGSGIVAGLIIFANVLTVSTRLLQEL